MKQIIRFLFSFLIGVAYSSEVFAEGRSLFQDKEGNGVDNRTLREGDIHLGDIPSIGLAIMNNLLYFVGSISIFFILAGAMVYVLGGLFDKAKEYGKTAIRMAIYGAVISWTGWFMVNFIIDNLG